MFDKMQQQPKNYNCQNNNNNTAATTSFEAIFGGVQGKGPRYYLGKVGLWYPYRTVLFRTSKKMGIHKY